MNSAGLMQEGTQATVYKQLHQEIHIRDTLTAIK